MNRLFTISLLFLVCLTMSSTFAPAPGADAKAVGAPDEVAARRLMLKWIKDNNRDAEWKDINGGAPITAEQILIKAEPTLPHLWQVTVRFKKGGSFGLHIEKATGRILVPVD
ncbi:hypothetical protein LBMAG57_13800 [Verrucomicrobiota bacterium]|nr:hypothetical protein LBMAG57_13800 [Verrucomicrobiota bacterium]